MRLLLSDNDKHLSLAPLTLTRPVAELRIGILTIRESWEQLLKADKIGYKTEKYLNEKFPSISNPDFTIAGNIKPNEEVTKHVLNLEPNTSLFINGYWVATRGDNESKIEVIVESLIIIEKIWHLFEYNHEAISKDFKLVTQNRASQKLNTTNKIIGSHPIFIEAGAQINFAILNTNDGPIYIGKDAEIMEGSLIRGPFSLGNNSIVKMGAKIYTGTTVGPHCKVGGEIANSILFAYSNKGHDGYLGNSIIGEWCNLGADTNTSNLKNNYRNIKLYDYSSNKMVQTDIIFCGAIMGDHSKTGINTMLNTACSIGVSANIFGSDFPPKYIPSFSWGGHEDSPKFRLEKAHEVAQNMMKRRNLTISKEDKSILSHIFKLA